MGSAQPGKTYKVDDAFKTLPVSDFFTVSANKAALQKFVCEKLENDFNLQAAFESRRLYLGGRSEEETKAVMIEKVNVTLVFALESTQEEADTSVILHVIYTDVIDIFIYYAVSLLKNLSELWVYSGKDSYVPVHEFDNLKQARCKALTFIHSLSGRDNKMYIIIIQGRNSGLLVAR